MAQADSQGSGIIASIISNGKLLRIDAATARDAHWLLRLAAGSIMKHARSGTAVRFELSRNQIFITFKRKVSGSTVKKLIARFKERKHIVAASNRNKHRPYNETDAWRT